jgi:hypothetical protein
VSFKSFVHAFSSGLVAATRPDTQVVSKAQPEQALAKQHKSVIKSAYDIFGDNWLDSNGYPRGTEAGGSSYVYQLPYITLRQLSHLSDLVRLCISEIQNQVTGLEWYLDTTDATPVDPKADDLLLSPDGVRSWSVWAREILEDTLTIDQVVLAPWYKNNKLTSVEVMDGADFRLLERISSIERTPPDKEVYQQISSGKKFSPKDLWLIQRNTRTYSLRGYSPVEQVVYRAMTNFWSTQRGLEKWKAKGHDKVLVGTTPDMTDLQQVKDHQERLDQEMLKTDERFTMIPGDPKIVIPSIPDIDIDDAQLLIRFVCTVFGIDPTSLVSQVNYNTANVLERWALLSGLSPMLKLLSGIANAILRESGYANTKHHWKIEADVANKQLIADEMEKYKVGTKSWQEMRMVQGDTVEPSDLKGHTWVVLFGASKNFDPETGLAPTTIARVDANAKETNPNEQKKSFIMKAEPETALTRDNTQDLIVSGIDIWERVVVEGSKLYKQQALAEAASSIEATEKSVIKSAIAELVDDGFSDVTLFEEAATWEELLQLAGINEAESLLDETVNINDAVRESALEVVGDLIGKKLVDGRLINNPNAKWRLSDETLSRINTFLDDAIKKNFDIDVIEAGIDEIIANPLRSATIARTEAARASNLGMGLMYEELGVKNLEIADNEGPNSCAACKAANGETWSVEKFMNNPIEHPNCVRIAFPAVEEEE